MIIHLGHVHELARYPVKSMAGVATDSAFLGWHGLQGDRRFAFRRLNDNSGFPWLTASRLPELLLYEPLGLDENAEEPLPTHVRTPEGMNLALGSAELQNSVAEKFGNAVELMKLKHGIFDEASVSVINLATISAICREAGQNLDTRRFRANIVIATDATEPFLEDGWIGGRLVFGGNEVGPMLSVTMRDLRCMMINLDPDTAKQDPRVMKAVVRLNKNNAGAYGTVARTGQISVGQSVSLITEHLPATFQSQPLWHPIDKGKWQTCSGCGRRIPVVDDLVMQSDGSLSSPGTFTYVCPFCSHCHVGARMRWNKDLAAQKACHSCGTGLSKDYQCSKCGYPRGWMRVSCPFCGNEQPVFAAHFVVGCDLFTLECVECESRLESLCIC
jgi:uncharacterized protein